MHILVTKGEAFIDKCNSKAGPGKVTLKEIQKHMHEHAPEPLRVRIPRYSYARRDAPHLYCPQRVAFNGKLRRHACHLHFHILLGSRGSC